MGHWQSMGAQHLCWSQALPSPSQHDLQCSEGTTHFPTVWLVFPWYLQHVLYMDHRLDCSSWSSPVLPISGLDWSWSGSVTVFFWSYGPDLQTVDIFLFYLVLLVFFLFYLVSYIFLYFLGQLRYLEINLLSMSFLVFLWASLNLLNIFKIT